MMWSLLKKQFKSTWISTVLSLGLFAGVTYFILCTEYNTIQNNLTLDELFAAVESIDVSLGEDLRHEGKIVHIVGPLNIQEPISEPDYNMQVMAVKLRKRVQMYQWIETSTDHETPITEPGEEYQKIYWYHKDWQDYLIDSSSFSPGHNNPSTMPMFSEMHIAESVKIGWITLGLDIKRKVNDYYDIWSDSRPDRTDIKLHSGFYYHGESALEHEVGDLRVHFSYAGRQDDIYTAVGLLKDRTLIAFSSQTFPAADPVSLLRKGSFTLKQLQSLERRDANINTWKYRFYALVQVFASVMTLHPDWLQMLLQCRWVSNSFRRSSVLWISLVVAFSFTLFVISLPWLMHKSAFGVFALAAALLPVFHYSTFFARRQPNQNGVGRD